MSKNVLAAAFSAVLPGTGQLYNHHWLKGIGFLVPVLILSGSMRRRFLVGEPSLVAMLAVAVLFGLVIWSVVDAYRSAGTS